MRLNVCFQCFLLLFLLFQCVGTTPKRLERSNEGCRICGRKTDKNKFCNVAGEDEDKENRDVVGALNLENFGGGDLCAACYRTVRKF